MLPLLSAKIKLFDSNGIAQQRLNLRESHDKPDQRDTVEVSKTAKLKVGGGFKLIKSLEENPDDYNPAKRPIQSSKPIQRKQSMNDLAAQIKLIEKKIKMCQKKIDGDKRRKVLEQQNREGGYYQQDFEKIVRKQMENQGYLQPEKPEEDKNFDYLTNPNKISQEPQPQPTIPIDPIAKTYSIDQGVEKLQKHYEHSLKKKFERREMFPHKPCRRKTPKLYITQKTNAINKYGKPLSDEEHIFRVITRETTPQEIYPTIPSFTVVKDSLTKNIAAYLGDYRPFIEKTKSKLQDKRKDVNQPNTQEVNEASKDKQRSIVIFN